LTAAGGFSDSLDQLFGFGYPSYGFSLTLNLPVKNRSGQAALGSARSGRRYATGNLLAPYGLQIAGLTR